ncbi:MAG: hypothetical protein D6824_00760 [Planctomycetota bacterium]|nr:MAG: hypothetical protein D6824_00760 [Planctomycetota bacterium]
MVPLVAVSGAFAIPIVVIVFGAVRSMVVAAARERTRREIAAYIAEGAMTPEEGERLMAAGESKKPKGCF